MNARTFRIGGIHPEENKLTHEVATQVAAVPKQAIFPLGQHIGAPAKPVVQKGDKVKVGTMIAEAGGFVSAPIYSSVSGTVFKIDTAIDATGYRKPVIIINVEGDEWEETIDRSDKLELVKDHPELTPEEIVDRIKTAGVVGMGGACFPTFIKLCPPPTAKAECVIINAVECEPYITADYRLMMEHADEILVGLELLMKAAKVTTGYIGIETNKPAAIDMLTRKCAEAFAASEYHVEVVPLKQRYPQGGEKQLVDAVIRRQVPLDVELAAVGILAVQDGAHGRVVDMRGLDAIQDVGVPQLLRVRGQHFELRVVDFVGLQAQPGRRHEGLAVVSDLVAERAAVGFEGNLEPRVGAGQDRQGGEEEGQDIHNNLVVFRANLLKFVH